VEIRVVRVFDGFQDERAPARGLPLVAAEVGSFGDDKEKAIKFPVCG
jgi:hypothetical protein